jgi:hypothetical protein
MSTISHKEHKKPGTLLSAINRFSGTGVKGDNREINSAFSSASSASSVSSANSCSKICKQQGFQP